MVESTAVREPHMWDQMDPAWHVAFAVFAGVGTVLVAVGAGPAGSRAPALVLLAAVVAGYALLGARALSRPTGSRLGWSYVGLAVPLVLTLFTVNPVGGGVLLFLLFPHIWRLLPTRAAIVATLLAMAGIAAAEVVRAEPDAVPEVLGWLGAMLVVSVLLGLWISRIAAQSVHRAELVAELQATRAELAAANRDIGALAERERLAREIHDTLAQGFTSILLLAQTLDDVDDATRRRHVARVEATARENLAESRALVAALAPVQLGEATLPAVLRRLVTRIGDELGVEATMTVEGDERALPAAHDVVLLRVSQEALANVRKHADAEHVELTLGYRADGVALSVRDDGRGFVAPSGERGFGLAGMRDRVREIGGTLAVHAAPGTGTCVEVRV